MLKLTVYTFQKHLQAISFEMKYIYLAVPTSGLDPLLGDSLSQPMLIFCCLFSNSKVTCNLAKRQDFP